MSNYEGAAGPLFLFPEMWFPDSRARGDLHSEQVEREGEASSGFAGGGGDAAPKNGGENHVEGCRTRCQRLYRR